MLKKFVQELFDEVLEDAFNLEEEQNQAVKPTPETVLGYSLYQEQLNWIDFCFKETGKTKVLNGARHYGKTKAVTIYGSALELFSNKQTSIIIATRDLSRSKGILRYIVYSLKKLGISISKLNSRELWLKENKGFEPNIYATTIDADGFRGRHVDIAILDDPVISKDERSEVERENTIATTFIKK